MSPAKKKRIYAELVEKQFGRCVECGGQIATEYQKFLRRFTVQSKRSLINIRLKGDALSHTHCPANKP